MVGRVARTGPGSLAVAAAVMTVGFGWAFAAPAVSAQASASVSIFSDDTGQAMFPSTQLGPGHPEAACVSVGASANDGADAVSFGASDVSGDLLPYLNVTVEMGSGGHFGDCSGFAGSLVFSGLLSDLAGSSSTGGVPTGWHPQVDPTRSFRITATVDPALTTQGLTAQGRFVWRLVGSAQPPVPSTTPSPSVSGSPIPTASPDPSDPEPSDPGTEPAGPPGPADPTDQRPADPTSDPTATPTASGPPSATPTDPAAATGPPSDPTGSPGTGGSGGGRASQPPTDLTIGSALAQLQEVIGRAQRTAASVITSPQYPLGAISLAMGFLLVQDLIDRRDPKLAVVTRSQRDNEISFPDRFAGSAARPGLALGSTISARWPWHGEVR